MSCKVREMISNSYDSSDMARSQEELQAIAGKIRKGCRVAEIDMSDDHGCIIYKNENLGLTYWVHDECGTITSIRERREY